MSPDHWNPASMLPPVGCPLLLWVGKVPGPAIVMRAERTTYLQDREGQMEYRLQGGSLITGRYRWTYP